MTHHLSTEDPALATLVLPTSCRQRAHSPGGPQPLTPKRGRGVAWLWTGAPLLVKGLNSRVVLRPQPSLPDRRTTGLPGLSVSLIPLYIRVP